MATPLCMTATDSTLTIMFFKWFYLMFFKYQIRCTYDFLFSNSPLSSYLNLRVTQYKYWSVYHHNLTHNNINTSSLGYTLLIRECFLLTNS